MAKRDDPFDIVLDIIKIIGIAAVGYIIIKVLASLIP